MNGCALLAFVVASLFVAAANATSRQLEQLCNPKNNHVELHTIGDIDTLIQSLVADHVIPCPEPRRLAVRDLEPIIRADNVCSEEVARKIGLYYEKHLSKRSISYWMLPKSLRATILAVIFEVSRLCEKALMDNLEAIDDESIELMNIRGERDSLTAVIGGSQLRVQNLFLVTNMHGIIAEKETAQSMYTSETVAVDREAKARIDQIKTLCRNKFKPIYEKLFTPLVILTSIGFEYTSGYVNTHRSDSRNGDNYKNWYTGMLVCEATLSRNVIEAPKSEEINKDAAMTILDEEDLEKLGDKNVSLDERPATEPADAYKEYKLRVRLEPSTDITSGELQKETKTVSKKRKEAKWLRKNVFKRLLRDFGIVLRSDSVNVGLKSNSKTSGKAPKSHWKQNALMVLIAAVMIGGIWITPAVVALAGLALVSIVLARMWEKGLQKD